MEISDDLFQELINEELNQLVSERGLKLDNLAILFDQQPSKQKLKNLNIDKYHTLLGLYEGIPLSERQGLTTTLPDRITLFKQPLVAKVNSIDDLKKAIRHTLWHEIAHYYGLNHQKINELE
jgi:predicted Zn-dependent protease with MMP-like domain